MSRLTALLLLLIGSILTAQDDLEKRAAELKRFAASPPVGWTDAAVTIQVQNYLEIFLTLLWDPDFHRKVSTLLPDPKPTVQVRVTGSVRTPFVNGNVLVVPVEFVAYTSPIAQLVGHDVYVEENIIPLDRPLLSNAFSKTRLLPLLAPLSLYVDNGQGTLQPYLPCPPATQCQFLQSMSSVALTAFVVLHEVSHAFLGHKPGPETDNIPNEIAADQNAAKVLALLAEEISSGTPGFQTQLKQTFDSSLPEQLRQVFRLAPIAWMQVELSRSDSSQEMFRRRQQGLLKQISSDERDDVLSQVAPEHDSENLARLRVEWSAEPELLLIDGVRMSPAEVKGTSFPVPSTRHRVFARLKEQFAYHEEFLSGDETTMQLQYVAPIETTQEDVQKVCASRQWFATLLRTSTVDFQPRKPAVAWCHFQALHGLSLDRLIDVKDWTSVPVENWSRLRRWQSGDPTLSYWR